MKHGPLEQAKKNGSEYVEATNREMQIRRGLMAAEKLLEAAREAKANDDPEVIARLIAAGSVGVEFVPTTARSVSDLRAHVETVREALRMATSRTDEARKAAADEIADELRAGEFGLIEKRIQDAEAELAAARSARAAFGVECDRPVQGALFGYYFG